MKIGFQVEHKHEILKIEPKGRKTCPDLQILWSDFEDQFCSNVSAYSSPVEALSLLCLYNHLQLSNPSPVVVELTHLAENKHIYYYS